jgi:hypothetical protein
MAEKFRREWVKVVTEDIIWICQLPRSGGTLLLRLFDSHPEFHCHPAVFAFNNENRIWPEQEEFIRAGDNVIEEVFSYMSLEKFHLQGLRKQSSNMRQEIYPIYFSKRWYGEIFELCLQGTNPRNYFDAFFTALFNAWRNNQNLYGNKKYIVGQMTLRKPRLYKKNFDNFKNDYPEGKMIFIVRKPDDWLASALNLKVSTPYSSDPVEIIKDYKIHLTQAIDMSKDDSFIVFKFEDLIMKPMYIMSELASILDISWRESLLYPTLNGNPFYQNSSFELERKASIDPDVIGKGRTLSNSILSAIDKECIDLYKLTLDRRTI